MAARKQGFFGRLMQRGRRAIRRLTGRGSSY